ncbi:hypothetical protein AAC387_Pa07g1147 [Persea americana]
MRAQDGGVSGRTGSVGIENTICGILGRSGKELNADVGSQKNVILDVGSDGSTKLDLGSSKGSASFLLQAKKFLRVALI